MNLDIWNTWNYLYQCSISGTYTQFLLPAGTVMCCNVRNTAGPLAKAIFSLLAYYTSCSTESQQDFLASSCLRYILTVIILYKSTTKRWTVRSLVHSRIWESQPLSQAPVTLGLGEKNILTMWDHHGAVSVWIFRQSQERQSLCLLKLEKKISGPKPD